MTNFVQETSNENLVKKDGLVPSASGLNTTIYRLPVGSSEKVAAILVDSETGNVDIRASDSTSLVKVDARNKKVFLGDTDIIAGIERAKEIANDASSVALKDIKQNGLYLQHNKKLTTRQDGQLLIDGKVFKGEKGNPGVNGRNGRDGRDGIDGKNGKDGSNGVNGRDGKSITGPAPRVERFARNGKSGVAITGSNGTQHIYDGPKGENAPNVNGDLENLQEIARSRKLQESVKHQSDPFTRFAITDKVYIDAAKHWENENIIVNVQLKNFKVEGRTNNESGFILRLKKSDGRHSDTFYEMDIKRYSSHDINYFSESLTFLEKWQNKREYWVEIESIDPHGRLKITYDEIKVSATRL